MDVLLVKDKWDDYVVANEKGVEHAALDLLRKRLEEDFWYDNWDDGDPKHQWQDIAEDIVKRENAHEALSFLMSRRDHEYEWVEVTTPRSL